MSRKRDELRWTPEGKAELATDRGSFPLVELTGKALADEAAKKHAKLKVRVAAGAKKKLDALGMRAAKAFASWTPKTKLTVESAAMIASLLGAPADDAIIAPFFAYVLEKHGAEFAVQVAIAMWTMQTDDNDRAIWLGSVDVTTTSAHDASCSYGKSDVVRFLAKVYEQREAMRAPLAAAVDAHYDAAPLPAKPPLAVMIDDHVRATALAKDFLSGKHGDDVYPHYGYRHLPSLCRDFATVKKLFVRLELDPWIRMFETLGTRALELYDLALTTRKLDGSWRDRMLTDLHNVHGPKAARIMTRYLMNKANRKTVVAYFARYPELLADVLADPACAEDHEYLVEHCRTDTASVQ